MAYVIDVWRPEVCLRLATKRESSPPRVLMLNVWSHALGSNFELLQCNSLWLLQDFCFLITEVY